MKKIYILLFLLFFLFSCFNKLTENEDHILEKDNQVIINEEEKNNNKEWETFIIKDGDYEILLPNFGKKININNEGEGKTKFYNYDLATLECPMYMCLFKSNEYFVEIEVNINEKIDEIFNKVGARLGTNEDKFLYYMKNECDNKIVKVESYNNAYKCENGIPGGESTIKFFMGILENNKFITLTIGGNIKDININEKISKSIKILK